MSYAIRVESTPSEEHDAKPAGMEGLVPNFVFEDEPIMEEKVIVVQSTTTTTHTRTSSANFLSVEKERIPRKITRKDSFFVNDDE